MMQYTDEQLSEWAALNQLNLTEFLEHTSPIFFILKCKLNMMNCQKSWKLRKTFLGNCLELEAGKVKDKQLERDNARVASVSSMPEHLSVPNLYYNRPTFSVTK